MEPGAVNLSGANASAPDTDPWTMESGAVNLPPADGRIPDTDLASLLAKYNLYSDESAQALLVSLKQLFWDSSIL